MRSLQRTVDQMDDVPVPQVAKDILEVVEITSQERNSERTLEQIVGVPVPRILEEIVAERILEHIVGVPVPRFGKNPSGDQGHSSGAHVGVHHGADGRRNRVKEQGRVRVSKGE